MTGRTAARTGALLAAALLVLGTTSGCGMGERVRDGGTTVQETAGAAGTAQESSRAELPDQDPGPADDGTPPAAPPAKQPVVTEKQVEAVEAAVGSAQTVVARGEAEVASDG